MKFRYSNLTFLALAALAAPCLVIAADTAAQPTPTFTKDIAPIFQEKCQDCHRKGSMAPMSLETYESSRPWAKSIRQRVVTKQMPPWHIDQTIGVQKFKNDMSLSDAQIGMIARWVDAGAPMGDPKDMPKPRVWTDDNEWKAAKVLGQPDFVVKSEPWVMPAHHQDVWWRSVSMLPVTEDRWVRAVEMRPAGEGSRKITHHAQTFLIQDDPDSAGPGTDPALNSRAMLMEWAIGKQYDMYRPNTGKLIKPGSAISWDIHIHAVGEQLTDQVELAVWLYPKGQEPKYRTYLTGFQAIKSRTPGGLRLVDIPPNSIATAQSFTVLKQAAIIENFQPHMHWRGKAMEVEAILPDGTQEVVSYVGRFNFNWMTNYIYDDDAAPVYPKGTMIRVTAWYDNTKANPNNPDPDQWVGFGDRTVDEMGHAWMNVTYISDEDYQKLSAERTKKSVSASLQ
ncbi:MAG TPA: cytochrome c [Bryobacteraceae bacterium]|nr:cytochrome c [Bryobacteraceae bacterium]